MLISGPWYQPEHSYFLQGRKSHDILYVEIDYFINRLIEIQAVSSLPGYTSQP